MTGRNIVLNHRRAATEFSTTDESNRKISPRQMFEKQGFFKTDNEFEDLSLKRNQSVFCSDSTLTNTKSSSLLKKSEQLIYDLKPSFTSCISDRTKFDTLEDPLDIEAALSSKITLEEEVKTDNDDSCVFTEFEKWLLKNGAQFPELYLKSYSPDVRGVHAKQFIESYQTIVSIPLQCLITDHMGRTQTALGRRVFNSNVNLSTPNLIAVILYILTTRNDPHNMFQPYYKILPKSFSNFPIFWTEEELSWLKGSPILSDLEDRKQSMRADYDELCRVVDFPYSYEEFLDVRTAVGSRNFGIVVNGEKRTAMVPFADMLNHYRPRETSWTYENQKGAFTITSITALQPGQQVMDSYGKKCNSKFFLHYGFAVERNREEDGKSQNEINLTFFLKTSLSIYLNQSLQEERNDESKSKDELVEKKVAILRHLFNVNVHRGLTLSKAFRVSMNFEDKATSDALAFLRIKRANEEELNSIISQQKMTSKHVPEFYFSRCKDVVVAPLNPLNEANCLNELAASCKEQLYKYSHSYEENSERLNSNQLRSFSNERTALILIVGEQEICEFWIYAARILVPILHFGTRLEVVKGLSSLSRSNDRERDLWRYAVYLADKFRS